jgi:hypothetical protein
MAEVVRIKPHHFLDILTRFGAGQSFEPNPLGHAQHLVAACVLADAQITLELVWGADDICAPCNKLEAGRCTDTTAPGGKVVSKEAYNRALDERWLGRLGLAPGTRIIAAEYARLARERMGDIYTLYPEMPREGTTMRRKRLLRGIALYLKENA